MLAPPDFAIVVAADEARGIGRAGDLPWPRLPADLTHFRRITSDVTSDVRLPDARNAVIMGRRTWDSIPVRYRPLTGRLNVVVSRGILDLPDDVLAAGSLDDALTAATAAGAAELFVVGGGQLYKLAVDDPRCKIIFYTRIIGSFECDTHFPPFEDAFELAETLAQHQDGPAAVAYSIERWTRRQ